MLCQNCKRRQATVNHSTVINGKTCEYNLCAMCADEMFGSFEQSFANGLASGLFDEQFKEEKVCPSCGMRFADFERSGLLGCPSCYDVFHEELLPYIAKIQNKTEHIGKEGGINTAEHDERIKLAKLQEAMENALGRGDFITANKINEQMNAIKKKNTGGWRW
ncbi:MAG: hypothetical protein ACI4MS_07015 [Candidatus Coproplasma sp.]